MLGEPLRKISSASTASDDSADSSYCPNRRRDLKANIKCPDMSGIFNTLHKSLKSSTPCTGSSFSTCSRSRCSSEAGIFEKAKELANRFHGKLVQDYFSICKGKNSLKFNCINLHTFYVPVEEFSEDSWCNKCQEFYQKCGEVAQENGLQIVSGLYEEKISLKCTSRNHEFKISY